MMGRGLSLCRRRMGGSGSILSLSGMSYWVAGQETDSQNLTQLGSSGAGDAQFGSTSGADSNDPTSLPWYATSDYDVTVDGVNYKYLTDNLVTNGTFDTDTWWGKDASWSITGGQAVANGGGSNHQIYSPTAGLLTVGSTYRVTFDVIALSGSLQVRAGSTASSNITSTGSKEIIITAAVDGRFRIQANSTATATIDNVVVREVTANLGDHVYLPGTSGNYLSHPDNAAVSVTGDITIQVECALDDWAGASIQGALGKYTTTGDQRSYAIVITTSGEIQFYWSTDGTGGTTTNKISATLPATNGEKLFFQVRLDVDNGAGGNDVSFYTSVDGDTFSQLGSTQTTAGTTSIYDGTATLQLGAWNTSSFATGSFYSAKIWDNATASGTPVMHWEASSMTQSGGADQESGGTWTINRSASGLKSQLITRPQVDGATDDYLEVADHADLDVGDGVDFWVAWYGRYHGTPATNQVLVAKKADLTTGAGYAIYLNTSRQPVGVVGDGTNDDTITGTALGASEATLIVFQRNGSNIELIQVDAGGTVSATPVTDTTGDLSNALTLRMFRLSSTGTSYADASGFAWCQNGTGYLTAAQAASLKAELDTELAGRIGE